MAVSLHKAVKDGNIEQVKTLIDGDRELNERNIYGRTPLGVAIQFGHKEIAKILRERGCKE